MDRTNLKNYAPQARREFIQAMIDRAAYYGLTADKAEPVVEKGDVAVIGGRSFPIGGARKRKALELRIKRHGFQQTMEAMAYTWFNRLVAVRYMELHGYLDHGYRVLSHPEDKPTPEILEHAEHVEFPGLKKDRVIDLKLAGNKEGELYRLLLTAQCNALHSALPFLFERIDDETELLLPDNLLNSDSLIRKLVNEIDEADWQEVEIIGWLYQFYISERKDEVIGKVVASEDIPAATQLFTPNWIVKYLVQNTLGRQWLATYPDSPLRPQMEYYIEPAEQTLEVQEQLKEITPTSLNPEELTLLDPACGSGHILVEAYDLFKAIYQERGYRAKDIPELILQKNLFGMEIDDRAAQLAAFALMMKARADDRRIFDSEAKPNILAFVESNGLEVDDIYHALASPLRNELTSNEPPAPPGMLFETDDNLFTRVAEKSVSKPSVAPSLHTAISELLSVFENAKTFGSLIQVPPKLAAKLAEIEKRLDDVLQHGDLTHASAHVLKPILQQARLLSRQYESVIANPPYMGSKYYTPTLKIFVNKEYKEAKADLYACFMERNRIACTPSGFHGMINIPNWMFLSSFEEMRKSIFKTQSIDTFIHNGRGVFGSDFGSCAFVLRKAHLPEYRGSYRRLFEKQGSVASNEELEQRFHKAKTYTPSNAEFPKIPGSPVAYWVLPQVIRLFQQSPPLSQTAKPMVGLQTGDNERFIRLWHEVSVSGITFSCDGGNDALEPGRRWFPYTKGGEFRKWYGNQANIINWERNGEAIRRHPSAVVRNSDFYFKEGLSYTNISSTSFAARYTPKGHVFDQKGSMIFCRDRTALLYTMAFLHTVVAKYMLHIVCPTIDFNPGDLSKIPLNGLVQHGNKASGRCESMITISKADWDSCEVSWDFQTSSALSRRASTVLKSQETADDQCLARFAKMKELEEENNRLFIEAYGLQDELSPEVPDEQITLYRPDRTEDIKRLISYAIGCMLGRYSLDTPGLIYAHGGNQGFDPDQYKTFRADDDGIIPLLETDWGIRDDCANRIVEFVGVAWPKEYLEENLTFIADSIGPNSGEQPRDTIRRYLAIGFYKHHLPMYKKRPIYWLFSSGKLRAFQCLVYLHRYNEGTLARMRTEYVIPLQGQITARIDQLEGDKAKATSTSHRTKIQKEQDKLKKQQAELATFEEKLKHYADMRISLDLDDGVKVNYAKFGDLLAESKAITGGKDDE